MRLLLKTCRSCHREKEVSEFNKNKRSKDGYQVNCRVCTKNWYYAHQDLVLERKKDYHSENKEEKNQKCRDRYGNKKEEYLENNKKSYKKNPIPKFLARTRDRAKEKGLEFNLDASDIMIPEFCPILGIKIATELGQGQLETNASIDRIDPSRGYIKGNVWMISRKANTMKSNATVEQLISFGKWCRSLEQE